MAGEAVERLRAKLQEMNCRIVDVTLGDRPISDEKVAEELYQSLLKLEQGDFEENEVSFGEDDDVLNRFKQKYNHPVEPKA